MSIDMSDWSEKKRIKYSLVHRAVAAGLEGRVLLIQWRLAQERHLNSAGAKIAKLFEEENAGQPQALRALTLLSQSMGLSTIYKDTATLPKPEMADIYIKPGFLERVLERVADPALPVSGHLNQTAPKDRIASPYARLMDVVNDYSKDNIFLRSIILEERMDEAVELLRTMPVASNDKAVRLSAQEAVKVRPDYNDSEDAQDLESYVAQSVAEYTDDDPDNDPVNDEIVALAARNAGPKFGWQ